MSPRSAMGLRSTAALSLVLNLMAAPAQSATFTVNVVSDTDDGICDKTECSLREAIQAANGSPGFDEIAFDIPGHGEHQIVGELPPLTGPTLVDGYTQPGSAGNSLAEGNDAVLLVRLPGLTVSGGNTTLRGLAFSGRWSSTVLFTDTPGNTDNVVEGCWVLTRATGEPIYGLPVGGVKSEGGSSTMRLRIGGVENWQRNVLNAGSNFLGGYFPALDIESDDAVLINNYVGSRSDGLREALHPTPAKLNGRIRFGGAGIGERNVVLSHVWAEAHPGSVIEGNFIGLHADGRGYSTRYYPEAKLSVRLHGGAIVRNNTIVTDQTSDMFGSVALAVYGPGNKQISPPAVVSSNRIGLAIDGATVIPLGVGISVTWAGDQPGLVVGGPRASDANYIAGAKFHGIGIYDASGVTVQGNRIGLDVNGSPAGGDGDGIVVSGDSTNIRIGAESPGGGNHIAYQGGTGVVVKSVGPVTIRSNRMFQNGALAIDLFEPSVGKGATLNDTMDVDSGANGLLNHPLLHGARLAANGLELDLALETAAFQQVSIEVFRSSACPGERGHAQQSVHRTAPIETDAMGQALLTINLGRQPLRGYYSATATDSFGNTSEVSACQPVELAIFSDGMESQ